jgi:DNA ligase-associated metallophosphoesterase
VSGAWFRFAGAALLATPAGGLWWKSEATLVVADLHLEKGSSLARRGALLPPYDTRATLARLAGLVEALAPRRVICLGDSFHDGGGPGRLAEEDAGQLESLARGREWLWIAGNHDPAPAPELPGSVVEEAAIGPLVFRHQASPAAPEGRGDASGDVSGDVSGEVSGHYHPKAAVVVAGRRLTGRCFATDGRRLILPAFGAYAGGLCVLDPAIAALLAPAFTAHLIGRARVHTFPSLRLSPFQPAWR